MSVRPNKGGRPRIIDLDNARRLRRQGKTFREIAELYGVKRESVYGLLKYHSQKNGVRIGLDSVAGKREKDSTIRADEGSKG